MMPIAVRMVLGRGSAVAAEENNGGRVAVAGDVGPAGVDNMR